MTETTKRILPVVLDSLDATKMSGRANDLVRELESLTVADVGMTSLDYVTMIKRIGDEFGVTIPPEKARNFQSFQDLTAYLDG